MRRDARGDTFYYGSYGCRDSESYIVELLAPKVPVDDLPRDVDDGDAARQEGFPAGVYSEDGFGDRGSDQPPFKVRYQVERPAPDGTELGAACEVEVGFGVQAA